MQIETACASGVLYLVLCNLYSIICEYVWAQIFVF